MAGQSILLTGHTTDGMRYRLPAPLREIAAEPAGRANETSELERRHRDALMHRAHEAIEQWCGPRQRALVARTRLDHPGYVASMHWSASTSGEEQEGLWPAASLWPS